MKKLPLIKAAIKRPVYFLMTGFKGVFELSMKDHIASKYQKTQLPTIDFLEILPDFHEYIDNYSFLTGTSLVTDILLLKSLAKRKSGCAYLEIGSWRGESLVNVADVTDDCTVLTLSADEMKVMGSTENFVKVHGIFSRHKTNIKTYYHNSLTFDFKTLDKKFDLIFIDGDHSYEGVNSDTKNAFSVLKDEKSIIVWHDYGFSPEEVRYSVLAAILDGIPPEKHGYLYHVSNTMCAIYTTEKINSSFISFPSYPNKKFYLDVKAVPLR